MTAVYAAPAALLLLAALAVKWREGGALLDHLSTLDTPGDDT